MVLSPQLIWESTDPSAVPPNLPKNYCPPETPFQLTTLRHLTLLEYAVDVAPRYAVPALMYGRNDMAPFVCNMTDPLTEVLVTIARGRLPRLWRDSRTGYTRSALEQR